MANDIYDNAHTDYNILVDLAVAKLQEEVDEATAACAEDMPDGNPDDYFADIAAGALIGQPTDVIKEFKRRNGI